jgi:hypothetical protein
MAMLSVDNLSPNWTAGIVGLLTLWVTLRYLSARKLDPREPTVLPPWIPVVGHVLGMAFYGGRYVKRLG